MSANGDNFAGDDADNEDDFDVSLSSYLPSLSAFTADDDDDNKDDVVGKDDADDVDDVDEAPAARGG